MATIKTVFAGARYFAERLERQAAAALKEAQRAETEDPQDAITRAYVRDMRERAGRLQARALQWRGTAASVRNGEKP